MCSPLDDQERQSPYTNLSDHSHDNDMFCEIPIPAPLNASQKGHQERFQALVIRGGQV